MGVLHHKNYWFDMEKKKLNFIGTSIGYQNRFCTIYSLLKFRKCLILVGFKTYE